MRLELKGTLRISSLPSGVKLLEEDNMNKPVTDELLVSGN